MSMLSRLIDRLADKLSYDDLCDLYNVLDNEPRALAEALHELLLEIEGD